MPIDDRTSTQNYPKPNIANTLADDVGRLRTALDDIDSGIDAKAPKASPVFTGTAGIPLGSASAPSLYFTGDNTGLYSPGADQVAISTGGTGRLFIDNAGNIGIGGTPATKLDIAANNTTLAALNTLRFTDTDTTSVATQETGRIEFYTSDSTQIGVHSYISAQTLDASSNGALTIGTGLAGSASERLRIDNTGRVLIGTSTAIGTSQLQVNSGTRLSGLSLLVGNTIASNVDVANATYDSVSFSVSTQETEPRCIFFSPDGRKMFITGSSGDDVNEYALSTPWNASTASYVTIFSVSSQETQPNDLYFRADGKKLYIVGTINNTVYQYSLSAPWSVASASYDSVSFSVATQESATSGLTFKPDGTRLYIIGAGSDTVHTYTLSTPWDVSTASNTSSFSVSAQETQAQSVEFTADGSKMFVMGIIGDDINIYNLTTPWDITTASFAALFSVSAQETAPSGLFIKPDGTKFYIVGTVNDTVYQYTIPSVQIDLTGTTNLNGDARVAQNLTIDGRIIGSGNLVLATTDTGSTSTERLRITNDGVQVYNQAAPAAVDTTATLTVANLKTGIITSTTAAAVTMTLPTGTDTEAGFSGIYTNMTFEWSVINTGATNAVTVQGGAGHTLVGSGTVAASNSGRFASRRTASNTFVTYRLSS